MGVVLELAPVNGLEKKFGLGEMARARCGSGRFEPARELWTSRAESVLQARKFPEPG